MDGLVGGRDVGAELALRILAEVRAEAQRQGLLLSACVVDRGGHVVASCRMDGAQLGAMPIAVDKAYTAALWNARTGEMAEPTLPGNGDWGFPTTLGGRMIVFQGGVPIRSGDELLGALGISGALSEEDEACALAALAAVGLSG